MSKDNFGLKINGLKNQTGVKRVNLEPAGAKNNRLKMKRIISDMENIIFEMFQIRLEMKNIISNMKIIILEMLSHHV